MFGGFHHECDREGHKTDGRAVIIANRTPEGMSLIDIQLYARNGRLLAPPSKQVIDEINATLYLDRESLRSLVAKQYGLLPKNVTFL